MLLPFMLGLRRRSFATVVPLRFAISDRVSPFLMVTDLDLVRLLLLDDFFFEEVFVLATLVSSISTLLRFVSSSSAR